MKVVETYIIKCTRVTEPIEQCYEEAVEKINANTDTVKEVFKQLVESVGFKIDEGGFISSSVKKGW